MKLQTRIGGALVTALAVVIVVAAVSLIASTSFIRSVDRIEHGRDVIESLDAVLEDMIDVETSTRGFAITGQPEFLEPYERARDVLPTHTRIYRDALAARGADDGAQVELERLIQDKLEHAAVVIELRRTRGPDAALATIQEGQGKVVMDKIRALVAGLKSSEDAQLAAEARGTHERSHIVLIASIGSAIAMILVVFAGFVMIRRTIVRPLAALATAARQAGTGDWNPGIGTRSDELGDLDRELASMVALRQDVEARLRELVEDAPQPFFLADLTGRYTYVNRAACALLGYPRDELLGRTIFDLIRPEDAVRLEKERTLMLDPGTTIRSDWELRASDGTMIPVEVSAKILSDGRWQAFVYDLRDRKRLEEERQRSLRQREALISVVSHDLKSPLNAIELRERLLARSADPKVKEQAASIRRAVVAMQRMIRGLLDGASLEAGALKLIRGEHDLAEVITEVIDVLAPIAADAEIELCAKAEAGRCVSFDRDRIAQVVYNLVGNALKFTPAGGKVTIALAYRDGEAEIAVEDTGPGIAAEALPHIFEKFFTSGGRVGGTGLGLDIAKGLVEAHGGQLTAASEVGHGSTFRVTLPHSVQ